MGHVLDDQDEPVGSYLIMEPVHPRDVALHTLQALHAITADEALDFHERLQAILALGAGHFDLPLGIINRVDGDVYTVEHVHAPHGELPAGSTFEVGGTYCSHTLRAHAPTGFHHAGRSSIREHPCYQSFGLEAYLGCPVRVGGEVYGTLNFSRPEPTRPFTPDDYALINLIGQWVGHAIAQRDARRGLERMASYDDLTGMFNRRAFLDALGRQLAQGRRSGRPTALLLFDLDHFKRINDRWGHSAGDQVLRSVGARCLATVREGDVAGRVGGEEFAMVLPDTTLEAAEAVAARLAATLREHPVLLTTRGARLTVTASIGVAEVAKGETAVQAMSRADEALYEAKAAGRDEIRLAS